MEYNHCGSVAERIFGLICQLVLLAFQCGYVQNVLLHDLNAQMCISGSFVRHLGSLVIFS